MKGSRGLARSAAVYTFGGGLQFAGAIAALPLLAWLLEPREFGIVVTLQLVVQVGVHLGALGLPTAAMREHFSAGDGAIRSDGVVVSAIPLAAAVTVVIALTAPVWVLGFGEMGLRPALWLAVASMLPRAWTGVAQGRFRALDRPWTFLTIAVSNTVGAQLGGVVAVWLLDPTPGWFMAGWLVASSMTAAAAMGASRAEWRPLAWHELRTVLIYTLPISGHALGTLAIQVGDRFLIERALGVVEVGRYHVAYLVATLTVPLLTSFSNAWTPRLASRVDGTALRQDVERHGRLVVFGAAAVGAVLGLLYPIAAAVVLPETFAAHDLRTTAAILSGVAVPVATYVIAIQILVVDRRTLMLVVATPISAVLSLSATAAVLPHYGLAGAAWTTLVTYIVSAIVIAAAAHRSLTYRLLGPSYYGAVAMSAIAVAVSASWHGGASTVGRPVLACLTLGLAAWQLRAVLGRFG